MRRSQPAITQLLTKKEQRQKRRPAKLANHSAGTIRIKLP